MADITRPNAASGGPSVLAICILIILSTALSPPLGRMFGPDLWQGLGRTQQGWSVLTALTGFLLVLFILSSGVLGDLYGRRRVLAALLIAQIALLGFALVVPDKRGLVNLLTALAVTGAMIRPLVITYLIVSYQGRDRIVAVTVFAAASGLAIVLVPVVDNLLLDAGLSWLIFLPPLLLAVLGLFLLHRYLPSQQSPEKPRPINMVIVALWAAAVCAIAYGVLLMVGLGADTPIGLGFFITGIAGVGLIHYFEKWPIAKEIEYELHRERTLSIAIISGIVLALALQTVAGQFFYFFKDIQDAGAVQAGLRLLPILVGAVILGALAARITARQGERVALALGLVVLGLSVVSLSILEPDIPYPLLAPFLMFIGFGFVLGNSPRVLLLSRSVPARLESTVQSIGVATTQVGSAMAYTMTLGLITFFSQSIYSDKLAQSGLSPEAIEGQLEIVEVVINATRGSVPPEQQAATIAALVPAYEQAHTQAVAQTLLVLGLICFGAAALVYFGVSDEGVGAPPIVLPADDDETAVVSQGTT